MALCPNKQNRLVAPMALLDRDASSDDSMAEQKAKQVLLNAEDVKLERVDKNLFSKAKTEVLGSSCTAYSKTKIPLLCPASQYVMEGLFSRQSANLSAEIHRFKV
ncbi:hypothetical protein M9H77_10668 [Catharanthus roseus]|uniref:Uncharacterized protein n=1 Tax=Catharanthus roseus TaxID=4058 RepID=A0ACC0BCD5_CATRO|nr:hypothetical protein M9H77_10668 [Catharanthus roseus]